MMIQPPKNHVARRPLYTRRRTLLDRVSPKKIAWGTKVSAAFKAKVIKISGNLGVDPNHLMAAMAFESAETFSSSVKNVQSGATGLFQFMP
jgi:membrane-bound lytic murein transglycosylase B